MSVKNINDLLDFMTIEIECIAYKFRTDRASVPTY